MIISKESLINCPSCKSILNNSYIQIDINRAVVRKQCLQINHKFICMYKDEQYPIDMLYALIELDSNTGDQIRWDFIKKDISFINQRTGFSKRNAIDWFIPDFNNYKSIKSKLKTYMMYI